ncbi:MAG TPA: hypothetical protein VMS22_25070 [Candidatus Eisenbacteria bacterium]|nr:hypothetical protein [Candidatus Eisenbacteria bacterium]
MIRASTVIAVAMVIAGAADAGATGCVGRNGKLTSRANCKKSERPLDGTAVSPTGPAGQAGLPGKQGGFPLAILDAHDQEVGTVLSFEFGTALVSMTYPGFASPVRFAVASSGFTNLGDDAFAFVEYTEANCNGQPHLSAMLGAYAHLEGSAAYLASGSAASIPIISYETDIFGLCDVADLTVRGTCCIAATFNDDLVPAVRIALPDFTPPFRAVLR